MIQLVGNSYTFAVTFTGLPGELRYDSSNWDLLLHDGTTEGGHRFLNLTNSDERYQARSTELDGLLDFEPQQRGLLVRRGPSDYRIRAITVNENQLKITNPQGYAGNPLFEFQNTIQTPHTWTEAQTFESEVQAVGGVRGNVVGNLTGDSTGNHTGDVVGNLEGDSVGLHSGSVDVRGGDLFLDDGQILPEWLSEDIVEFILLAGAPVGGIMMWSGAATTIPAPWLLCDGSNGTPDLRDRFILGAGQVGSGTTAPGSTGGTATHAHTGSASNGGAHSHDLDIAGHALTESEMPSHNHPNGIVDRNADLFNNGGIAAVPGRPESVSQIGLTATVEGLTKSKGGGQAHTHEGSVAENGGAHSHSLDVDEESNIPPYYALCFIMKGA